MSESTTPQQRPLRILYLDHSTEPGGAELALRRLVWDQTPWRTEIALPNCPSSQSGVFSSPPAHVKVSFIGPPQEAGATDSQSLIRRVHFISSGLGQALALRRSAAFRSADIVYANTSRSAIYGALAALFSRKKLMLHLRDFVTRDSLGTLGLNLMKLALRRADAVIANSNSTLATARPALRQRTETRVIPSSFGQVRPTQYEALESRPLRIGMVARIDRWKGHELLIQAFAAEFSDSDARLAFAGSAAFGKSDLLEELKTLAQQLGVASRVDFLGHVGDVEGFIHSLDICVQTSLRPEPLGQNILQYLAAGRAVLAVDRGGPAEWIQHGETGQLFKMGDLVDLRQHLKVLAEDHVLRERLARLAPSAVASLTPESIRASHADLYRQMSKSGAALPTSEPTVDAHRPIRSDS